MAPETQQAHLQPLWLVPQGELTAWPHVSLTGFLQMPPMASQWPC